jgi:hypothetical protein
MRVRVAEWMQLRWVFVAAFVFGALITALALGPAGTP